MTGHDSTERYGVLATGCRQVSQPTPDLGESCETVLLDRTAFLEHLHTGDLTDLNIAYICVDLLER